MVFANASKKLGINIVQTCFDIFFTKQAQFVTTHHPLRLLRNRGSHLLSVEHREHGASTLQTGILFEALPLSY